MAAVFVPQVHMMKSVLFLFQIQLRPSDVHLAFPSSSAVSNAVKLETDGCRRPVLSTITFSTESSLDLSALRCSVSVLVDQCLTLSTGLH